MKRAIILLLLLFPAIVSRTWATAAAAEQENLPSLIAVALANNPELKASAARWQMFRSRVAQAGAFEDPMLMLKIQNGLISAPLSFNKEAMTAKVIGVSQQIPFWGKRGLRGEQAQLEAETYRWQVEERKLELRRMVSDTYFQLYFTDKSLEIVAGNIRILDDFITLAETKYTVGQGPQQDVFKAQVERSKLLDMRISLEQQRRSLQAGLNALLYRSADTPVGPIPDFELKPVTIAAERLRQLARENRPLLKGLRSQIDKGKIEQKLADKENYPDFTLSLEYMQREPAMGGKGDDMYSLGVTFNLPLQRERRHALAAESAAATVMAEEELRTAENGIDAEIATLLAQLERRQKLATLYRTGIIPQAEQTLESATIGYRVNKVDFLTLLDNRLTLFNYQRDYYESLADYMAQLARLEATVGLELKGN